MLEISRRLYRKIRFIPDAFFSILFFPFFYFLALVIVTLVRLKDEQNRLVWGDAPIINNAYWSEAMRSAGYKSEIFTDSFASSINTRQDYGRLLQDEMRFLPVFLRRYFVFLRSLLDYDFYFISFTGFFLGKTTFWWMKAHILKLAKKRIIILPFGGDAHIFHRMRSVCQIHGSMMSFPYLSREQRRITRRVDYWVKNADIVVPSFMGPDGIGRWDVIVPSSLCVDVEKWRASTKSKSKNKKEVTIVHSPNFRGFKGSEFLIKAIAELRNEGFKINFKLIEGKQNSEVREILMNEADILVEQLIATGHGLNGVEGMAAGVVVISNLTDEVSLLPFRRWSYFDECPIVSASPENLKSVLRLLIENSELRRVLGIAGRKYAEKYHSFAASQFLFGSIIKKLNGGNIDLINLYNPLTSEYSKILPYVSHPLVHSRLPDGKSSRKKGKARD